VGRFATHIDKHCTVCGAIENDTHLFFLCNLPHQVWDITAVNPFIHLIDPHTDGVQHILSYILPLNTTEQNMTKILLLLWYIWKTRNDQRFQRKVWTFMQVQHATQPHFNTNSRAWGDQFDIVAPHLSPTLPPSTLQGYRCYIDAATAPDSNNHSPRIAGLEIFIVNTNVNPPLSMFIKAFMQGSTSVLMAESTALALATSLCRMMNLEDISFFTDSQLLVNCINRENTAHPPDWRIKPFTQAIVSSLQDSYKVHKIPRIQNYMAHSLANRALHHLNFHYIAPPSLCTNSSHVLECPLLNALHLVTIKSVMVLTA
jgi:ribonuclease HI